MIFCFSDAHAHRLLSYFGLIGVIGNSSLTSWERPVHIILLIRPKVACLLFFLYMIAGSRAWEQDIHLKLLMAPYIEDTYACRWVNYALQSVLKCEFMSKENKTKYLKCLILLWTPVLEGNEEFPAGSILVLVNYFGYLCSFLFLFSEFCWCNIKTCNTAAGAIKGSNGLTYNLLRAFFLDQPLRRSPHPQPQHTHTPLTTLHMHSYTHKK